MSEQKMAGNKSNQGAVQGAPTSPMTSKEQRPIDDKFFLGGRDQMEETKSNQGTVQGAPLCSHCSREVTKKVVYCSVICQKASDRVRRLMDKSSSRWIEALTMDEIFRLRTVSKTCTVMVNHGWVPYDVAFPSQYSSSKKVHWVNQNTISNSTLINLWKSAGNQMRTLKLNGLHKITATGFATLYKQPLLRELDLTNCKSINGIELMATFFVKGSFTNRFPLLRDVKLSGVVGLTHEDLNVLHNELGIICCDLFECQLCSKLSAVQAQCRYNNCQPSTTVLCKDCANTAECSSGYCKEFGCVDCTNDYEDWLSCELCEVQSCDSCCFDGCACMYSCDLCGFAYCGKFFRKAFFVLVLQEYLSYDIVLQIILFFKYRRLQRRVYLRNMQ